MQFDCKRLIEDPDSLRFEFTGRGSGSVKCSSSTATARCREHAERYLAMRERARALIARERAE